MKIKKGDEIKVVSGREKGKTGKVERVFAKEGMVLVTNVNMYKRHVKSKMQNQKSEIKTIAKPLPVANVMVVCPKCHEVTRMGYTIQGDKKTRMCKKCDQIV